MADQVYPFALDDRPTLQLLRACRSGKIEDVIRISGDLNITGEDVRSCGNLIFRMTCSCGRLDIAQWLVERYELTSADIIAERFGAFVAACSNAHLEVAQWLVTRFDLDLVALRFNCRRSMACICQLGHLAVVQWLSELFAISPVCEGDMPLITNMLRSACEGGKLEVARWLVERFGLTVEDVRAEGNVALRISAEAGHTHLVQWLLDWIEPSVEERESILEHVPEEAPAIGDFIEPSVEERASILGCSPEQVPARVRGIRNLIEKWQPPPGPGDKPAQG